MYGNLLIDLKEQEQKLNELTNNMRKRERESFVILILIEYMKKNTHTD